MKIAESAVNEVEEQIYKAETDEKAVAEEESCSNSDAELANLPVINEDNEQSVIRMLLNE